MEVGKETIDGECKAALHTLEDKLVCGPVYLCSWITFISVIMFFFLGYLSQHVLSVYTRVRVDMRKRNYACGGQWVLCWGYSITQHHILNRKCRSYIYLCFWKENLNKNGNFFHLFHFLSPSLLGYSWCSLAGQNVWVSISNRALMSITTPGVPPKIHTFCQSSGIEGGWNEAMAGGGGKKWARGV